MQHTTFWHCVASKQLLWEHWDEESLLFDCRSGQTHSLTPLAVEIILLLEQQALPIGSIVTRLNDQFDLPNGLTLSATSALIEHFDALGLIEECLQ